MGYRLMLEWAWTDLALAQARLGQDATASLRVVAELDREMGIVPTLGPVPESRWIDPTMEATDRELPPADRATEPIAADPDA